MNIEGLKENLLKSQEDGILAKDLVVDLINEYVKCYNLEKYVDDIVVFNKSSKCIGMYYHNKIFLHEDLFKLMRFDSKSAFFSCFLFTIKVMYHELYHVYQTKIMEESLCYYDKFLLNYSLSCEERNKLAYLAVICLPKIYNVNRYQKYHDFFPHEKEADFMGLVHAIDLAKKLDVKNCENSNRVLVMNMTKNYTYRGFFNNKMVSPFACLENFKMKINELHRFVKNNDFCNCEKLILGMDLPDDVIRDYKKQESLNINEPGWIDSYKIAQRILKKNNCK